MRQRGEARERALGGRFARLWAASATSALGSGLATVAAPPPGGSSTGPRSRAYAGPGDPAPPGDPAAAGDEAAPGAPARAFISGDPRFSLRTRLVIGGGAGRGRLAVVSPRGREWESGSRRGGRVLPTDGHVHTEWSWDAVAGSMERSCARAVEIGLPSIAFTEHADYTRWLIEPGVRARLGPREAAMVGPDGRFSPPPLRVGAYLECVQRCRERFPGLRILTGLEIGEPHWHTGPVAALTAAADFGRLLGSVHTLALDGPRAIDHLLADQELTCRFGWDELMRRYLAEALRLAGSTAPFGVLAHIDYPVRHWPGPGAFRAADFEDEFRAVLAELAGSGRALEVNTVVPLAGLIVRWWHEAGGGALTFGSDAHQPATVARDFAAAAAMAEAAGFHPARDPLQPWRRHAD